MSKRSHDRIRGNVLPFIFLVAVIVQEHQKVLVHAFSTTRTYFSNPKRIPYYGRKTPLLYHQSPSPQTQVNEERCSQYCDDMLDDGTISNIVKLFFPGNYILDEDDARAVIAKYFDPRIEYTDTTLYKSIYGKEALLRNKKPPGIFGFDGQFHSTCNVSNQKITIDDFVVSIEDNKHAEGTVTTLCLLYTSTIALKSTGSLLVEIEKTQNDQCLSSKESSTDMIGISFLSVKKGKVTRFFDVKERGILSQHLCKSYSRDNNQAALASTIDSDEVSFAEKIKDYIDARRKESSNDSNGKHIDTSSAEIKDYIDARRKESSNDSNGKHIDTSSAEDIVSEYLEARNFCEMDKALNYIAGNCIMKDYSSTSMYLGKEAISKRLLQLFKTSQKSIVVDNMYSGKGKNNISIGVEWHIENKNKEIERFGRGVGLYVVNIDDGAIVKGIELIEPNTKEETSDAESVRTFITPWLQNKIRDSGLGGFIADTLVQLSMPGIAAENTAALSTYIDLTLKKKVIQYGKHNSQIMDLFLPEDPNSVRGVAFFVVSEVEFETLQ